MTANDNMTLVTHTRIKKNQNCQFIKRNLRKKHKEIKKRKQKVKTVRTKKGIIKK